MKPPPFEPAEPASTESHLNRLRQRRDDLAAWLLKKGGCTEADELAGRMLNCKGHDPCKSGACPICAGKIQLRLAKSVMQLATHATDELFVVTVVPASSAVQVGALDSRSQADHSRRLKRYLLDAPFKWLVGGTDFSLNEHATGRYEPFWQPHENAIGEAAGVSLRLLRKELEGRFPITDAIPRPVKLQRWDGRWNAPLYAFKLDFDRRVGVDNALRLNRTTGETRLCRATTRQKLRSAERLELVLHLDRIGLTGRLFSASAQLHSSGRRINIRLCD